MENRCEHLEKHRSLHRCEAAVSIKPLDLSVLETDDQSLTNAFTLQM